MAASLFRSPRSRHPLLRVLSALIGLVLVGAALVFGFFLVLGLAAVGAAIWAVRQFNRPATPAAATTAQPRATAQPASAGGVIEGEFVVVREPATPSR
ncbi:MAG: hypothetical protein ABS97_20975 [Lysobacteraceae bacterium SCN 69-320]|nr:MAG: hypothetical protein ABS97_20975 [Xanthomonadaceae bacterium SCN 69-320]